MRTLGPKAAEDVGDADLALVVVREPEASGLGAQLGAVVARRRAIHESGSAVGSGRSDEIIVGIPKF